MSYNLLVLEMVNLVQTDIQLLEVTYYNTNNIKIENFFLILILVTTTGGTSESDPCVFPFKYNGKLYYEFKKSG